jgi:hypothetical protein
MKPTETTVKELELLFEFVPPGQLRKDITFLLFKFLTLSPPENIPVNAKEFYENIYFLIDFLEKVNAEKTA